MSSQQPDWEDIAPPYAPLFGLSMLVWFFIAIFNNLDPTRYIFTGSMSMAALLSTYYLVYTRRMKRPLQGSSIGIFVALWMGITSFTSTNPEVDLYLLTLKLLQVEYLVVLPLVIIWAVPYNDEFFFGLKEITEEKAAKTAWKSSIIMILIIRFFFYDGSWPILEFLILLPFINEAYQLYQLQKDAEYPVLTLFIQQELSTKFAVPISMLRAVGVIMTAFMFGFLFNRFWLIVILLYFVAGIIWTVDFFIPLSESERERNNLTEEDLEEFINKVRKDPTSVVSTVTKQTSSRTHKKRHWKLDRDNASGISMKVDKPASVESVVRNTKVSAAKTTTFESTPEQVDDENDMDLQEIPGEIVEIQNEGEITVIDDENREITISEKAHALGLKVRNEFQKPQYNLNHILSTLTQEDFSTAYRVGQSGLIFNSYKGEWSPPADLIIFPIELEDYDYRRIDQILLLGFNTPRVDGQAVFNIDFGEEKEKNKYNTKITSDSIQIGDTIFNMKTLIIDRSHWEEARPQLDLVTDNDDIEYTGFKTLKDMQDKLIIISDKWIEFRKQAQDAVINFLAGLFGAQDPIFLSREKVETELLEEGEYTIEDIEDINDT